MTLCLYPENTNPEPSMSRIDTIPIGKDCSKTPWSGTGINPLEAAGPVIGRYESVGITVIRDKNVVGIVSVGISAFRKWT